MKLPHYLITRITPPAEGEKGVTLQCQAAAGGLTPHQPVLVTPSGTEAEIKKVQQLIGDSYLVTIKGCMRSRLKEGGALLPLKSSCFLGNEALFVHDARDLPRGTFMLTPPDEYKALYPHGAVEARISGKPGHNLCIIETRFSVPFIPLLPWSVTSESTRQRITFFCADKPPRESINKGELEMFSGFFKNGITEKNLFLLRLKLNQALFVPTELKNIPFTGYTPLKDLRIGDKLLDKTRTLIIRRAAAQGGVKFSDIVEASGLPENMARMILEETVVSGEVSQEAGWVLSLSGEPEKRLSPTGREVLKKMREKGNTGTRKVLVKDPGLQKTIDELCRMKLLFTDGDVILSIEAFNELAGQITKSRKENPDAAPTELAASIGAQRKVIFSVLKKLEESGE